MNKAWKSKKKRYQQKKTDAGIENNRRDKRKRNMARDEKLSMLKSIQSDWLNRR